MPCTMKSDVGVVALSLNAFTVMNFQLSKVFTKKWYRFGNNFLNQKQKPE